jgi:hypothetical protein
MYCPSSDLPQRTDPVNSPGSLDNQNAGVVEQPIPMYAGIQGATDGNTNDTSPYRESRQCPRGIYSRNGIFWESSYLKPAKITDGLSHTMILGEQSDWGVESVGTKRDIRSGITGGVFSSQCHSCFISSTTKQPFPLSLIAGKNVFSYNITVIRWPINEKRWVSDATLGKSWYGEMNKPIQSVHPGGAHVALADASSRFLTDATDITILRNLGCRYDGLSSKID